MQNMEQAQVAESADQPEFGAGCVSDQKRIDLFLPKAVVLDGAENAAQLAFFVAGILFQFCHLLLSHFANCKICVCQLNFCPINSSRMFNGGGEHLQEIPWNAGIGPNEALKCAVGDCMRGFFDSHHLQKTSKNFSEVILCGFWIDQR